jgi:cob(I)alamin adenosyltransferase
MSFYYTCCGDGGKTSLFGTKKRISKASTRAAAFGDVDELQSFIGFARSIANEKSVQYKSKNNKTAQNNGMNNVDVLLKQIQEHLFILSAELASPTVKTVSKISQDHTKTIENEIEKFAKSIEPPKHFIYPSGSTLASILHVCRAVTRRTERAIISLGEKEKLNPMILAYMNRLSSLFFVMACYSNKIEGIKEDEWIQ